MIPIVIHEYWKWLKSDKHIITAFSLICLYMYVLQPLTYFSDMFGEYVNLVEPFMIILGNGYCIPIIVIAFVVTMIDFPDISDYSIMVMIRTSRTRWLSGQIIFVLLSSVSFVLLYFFISLIFAVTNSFVSEQWSELIKIVSLPQNEELRIQYPLATLDLSIANNYNTITAFFYSVSLMLLHLIFSVQFQMVLSLAVNKITGMCGNLFLLGTGLVLWMADNKLKWFFPFAHSTIGWHYDPLYNKAEIPIFFSLTYMVALNVILYLTGRRIMQKKMIALLGAD